MRWCVVRVSNVVPVAEQLLRRSSAPAAFMLAPPLRELGNEIHSVHITTNGHERKGIGSELLARMSGAVLMRSPSSTTLPASGQQQKNTNTVPS